ncbi:MAG: alpha/beta hydrolase-fold protein [Ignavibacteriales bacterium]|nr:alpha/beta hydrolase-fold protein [Ignavibacteriales bacterium]
MCNNKFNGTNILEILGSNLLKASKIFSVASLFWFASMNTYSQIPNKETTRCILSASIGEITSKITNKEYELIINLPYSYYKDTLKTYPVIYFCDGFYDFPLYAMIYSDQFYDKIINECFLVGFSYKGKNLDYEKLRAHDYTPTDVTKVGESGGALDFLSVIENEFIPFMEKNYRVNPKFRALSGCSLGGLFTLFAMFARPELFNAYIAISPAVFWIIIGFSNLRNNFIPPIQIYRFLYI